VNHFERIEFDEGCISFKNEEDKFSFAFTSVSGNVEQVSLGRWQLQLEAQPWRSGVLLQSAGTIRVRGDVAGTSARLQPAEISLHWNEASLADVLRLFRGQDYGVRGLFALDAVTKSGNAPGGIPGDWTYSLQARARRIHRWDLTERADNPALNANFHGRWNVGTATLLAEEISVEGPRSNLRGMFHFARSGAPSMELRLDSMGVQAADLLAWYRAFQPDVAEGVTAEQYFTGGMILRGWPLTLESAALSSSGGVVRIPGITQPIRIGAIRGGRDRSNFVIGPVRIVLGGATSELDASKKRRSGQQMESAADLTVAHDLITQHGSLSIDGNISSVEDFFKISAAFGKPVNRGWELAGRATAATKWEWSEFPKGRWTGSVAFNKASLTVAGLNLPLNVTEGELIWKEGRHIARILKMDGFNNSWIGNVEEMSPVAPDPGPKWKVSLSVDQLNAADLDR